ncbi:DNA excision repair protein ERCC-5 homolog [Nymphalis io]|uniref:DNA excision repair protein ERCC-5 homolog n=1 Tax=Inachis io TaxID=171585 RepID=UPI00216A221E|nr:DNA excision repair protein ERCC-5 homolog [Nymphalis io]
MGVTGLWRLIEPVGKPVPVETLENKVLAVDISIWLHQMVKGYQDAKGAPVANAHLMGLFQRLCKLLYFRVKPVFVFDGGFPDLKKETIAKRQDNKSKYNSQSERLKRELALLLGKRTVINTLLGKQISPKKNKPAEKNDDLFKLPALPDKEIESESESEDESSTSTSSIDLHSVDFESDKIKNMPLKEKYDLLVELKETRKMNSWGKLHTLPKKSDNFSNFQLERLLKRRKLQECLEETEKEMGDGCMSLNELESLLNEEGIDTKIESLPSRRIASNNTTRYLFISNVKQALADAKKREIDAIKQTETSDPGGSAHNTQPDTSKPCSSSDNQVNKSLKHDELDDDLQKAIQMSLECMDESETSACASKTDDSWTSFLSDSDYSDDECDGFDQPDMSSAKAYIKQYSDFTHKAIDNLVAPKQKLKVNSTEKKINKIIEELEQEKTIIEDNIMLMSSDEEDEIDNKIKSCTNPNSKLETTIVEKNTEFKLGSSNKIPLNSTPGEKFKIDENEMNDTQTSVIFVENSENQVISLEGSLDDVSETNDLKFCLEDDHELSSSSEDEFEEVSDSDQKPNKPAIELTLNMGEKIEDDIFADIFETKNDKELNVSNIISKCSDIDETIASNKITNKNNEEKLKIIGANKEPQCPIQPQPHKEYNTEVTSLIEKSDSGVVVLNKATINKDDNKATTPETNISDSPKIINLPVKDKISTENLNSMVTEIEIEEEELLHEKGRLDRIGRNITAEITKEAQELLQVFGIPYIVAPMEAEAQCAFLENVKLTDGTITDDSDIWLFGGQTVYKNFFNQKKHVLQYLSERIEKSFNLTREQLILLALLVGSDYTTGVAGVGPVTALEILASFPFNKKKLISECSNKQALYQEIVTGLQEFKKWVKAGKQTDNVNLKKKLKNINLADDFPSVRVVQAYLEPNVEKSEDKFTWGEIDITILRDYTKAKFGWSQNKLDEIMKPVLKRLLERKTQKTVHDYFKRKIDLETLEDQMSKRVKAAVQKMAPCQGNNEELENNVKLKRKGKNSSDTKGPSKAKKSKNVDELTNINEIVKASTSNLTENKFDVTVPKTDRYQEIIPQREKDKQSLLQNKLKAIELYRKTKIDNKKKTSRRKLPVPKEKADLSESSDGD